jgi:hypothetical protein
MLPAGRGSCGLLPIADLSFAHRRFPQVGLAPSHPLIAAHRRATDYRPLQLRYLPPAAADFPAGVELVSALPERGADEDEEGGEAQAAPPEPEVEPSGQAVAAEEDDAGEDGGGRGEEGDAATAGAPGAAAGAGGAGGQPAPPECE